MVVKKKFKREEQLSKQALILNHIKTINKSKWQNIQTATYFFLLKKHMPMLFHKHPLSETPDACAACLYFPRATSWSPLSWSMLPTARMALKLPGSKVKAVPRQSKAFWWSPSWNVVERMQWFPKKLNGRNRNKSYCKPWKF